VDVAVDAHPPEQALFLEDGMAPAALADALGRGSVGVVPPQRRASGEDGLGVER
jgi:hypothetical protein